MADDVTEGAQQGSGSAYYLVAVLTLFLTVSFAFGSEMQLGTDYNSHGPAPGDVAQIDGLVMGESVPGYACPATTCATTVVADGTEFTVSAVAEGAIVDGSNVWVGLFRNGAVLYFPAKSVYVTNGANQLTKLGVFTIAAVFFVAMMGLLQLARVSSARRLAGRKGIELLLASVTSSVGIGLIVISMAIDRDNVSVEELLSDSFINLGAGLVGAVVAFILFESVLPGRTASREAVARLDENLAAVGGDLSKRLGSIEKRLDQLTGSQSLRNAAPSWWRRFFG